LQVIFNAQQSNIMSLTPGNYSFVFFDKYSINLPGQGTDFRKLTANVTGPSATIFNQTYTQPSPFPVEGAVVGNFIASDIGLHSLGINTQDSIYWALTQCPVECTGDLKYNVSMSVVGESCHFSNITKVNTTINVPLGAKYNIQGVVKRGNPGQCQTNEDFFLKINNKTGPATEDDADPCAISLRVDPLGNFTFFTGINTVTMHTASTCPPDNSPNSVTLRQICLNRIKECGNGIVDNGEQCDDGNQNNNDACNNDCTTNVCGDGVIEDGVEECDDGNNFNLDGCNQFCQIEFCGDGINQLPLGEQCDDGNTNDNDACNNDCTDNICGDSIIEAGVEQCDDGNIANGDGCDSACQLEPSPNCGNGVIDAGEQCDDSNTVSGDGCSLTCQLEVCGNGILDAGEQCDDGNVADGDGCDQGCQIEPFCGDGCCDPATGENSNNCIIDCPSGNFSTCPQ